MTGKPRENPMLARRRDTDAQRDAVNSLFDAGGNLTDRRPVRSANIPVARIRPNPYQARREFTDLEELAAAIRAQGFTSRLRVRPDPGEPGMFQLVYGERRLRAAALADLTEIPCDIAEHSDADMIEIGLAENIQRRDLDPMEEAHAFSTFIRERGYSLRTLAERIGKSRGYLEGRLALLKVPEDVQRLIATRPDAIDAARQIAKIDDPAERQHLILGVADGSLASAQVRAIVHDYLEPPPAPATVDEVERGDEDEDAEAGPPPSRPAREERAERPERPTPAAAPRDAAKEELKQIQRTVEADNRTIQAIATRWRMLKEKNGAQDIVHEGVHFALERLQEILRSEAEKD